MHNNYLRDHCYLVLLTAVLAAWGLFFTVSGTLEAADAYASKVKSSTGYAGLLSKIERKGSVRVLVKVPVSGSSLPLEKGAHDQLAAISGTQDGLLGALAALGKSPLKSRKYKYIPYMAMTVDAGTLSALLASDAVTGVYEDKVSRPTLDKSVPRIGAAELRPAGITGKGVAVAVLDTGVDKLHPFLKGSVISEACYSSTEKTDKVTSLCPGKVEESILDGSAMPYAGACPMGHCGHGTHVAGIVAGRSGVSKSPGPGVAPGVGIIAIQVFSRHDSKDDCDHAPCIQSYDSDQISALERVRALQGTYNIAAVNMSLGGGQYTKNCDDGDEAAIKAIIDTLILSGTATVVSTGNEDYCGSMGAPACVSTAISVGATDKDDAIDDYSNSATFMTLLAPGSAITSAVPRADGTYEAWDGTSMAAPHVAGAWALLKQAKPDATVNEVLNAFTSTGLEVTDTGKCPAVTKKRINVMAAYRALTGKLTLTVSKSGKGSGRVTSSAQGIDCGNACAGSYSNGDVVTLTANPETGSAFAGWDGAGCAGTGECTVTISDNVTVAAAFTDPCTYTVSPEKKSFNSKGGQATVVVKATGDTACAAPGITVSDPWITATLSSFKKNRGTVTVFVYGNDNPEERNGTVTIGGETLEVDQTHTVCGIRSLEPSHESFEAAEDSGKFTVHVETDCGWTAAVEAPADEWVTITSGHSDSGTRDVSFHVAENDTGKKRTGRIVITLPEEPRKRSVFTVRQDK